MKILLCPEYFYPHIGGGEVWSFNVAKLLAKKGHKVSVLTYKQPCYTKDEWVDGVHIKRLGPFAIPGVQPYFRRALIQLFGIIIGFKLDYDVLLVSQTFPLLPSYFISKLRKKPIVAVFHDVYGLSFSIKEKGFFKGLIRSIIESIVCKLEYDVVLSVSNSTKNKLTRFGVKPEKVRIVGGGVDLEQVDAVNESKSNMPTIIFVGRLIKLKKVNLLTLAFKRVLEVIPYARLVIVGDGPLKEDLVQLAKKLCIEENVKFLGHVSWRENIRLIKEAHVLVQPSATEGFGLVLVEAMACKTPVIAVKLGGPKEVVVEGETGFLAKPNDVQQLAEKMTLLLRDFSMVKRMGEAGRRLVEERFTWNKVADKVERALYDAVKFK